MLRVLSFLLGSHLPVFQHRAPTSQNEPEQPNALRRRFQSLGSGVTGMGGSPWKGQQCSVLQDQSSPDQLPAAAGLCKCSSMNQHPAEPGPRQRMPQHSPAPCIATVLPSGRALRDLQPQR